MKLADESSSIFQEFDTTTIAMILIGIGLISLSWPTSLIFMLLGICVFPMWLVWRVVEHTGHKVI